MEKKAIYFDMDGTLAGLYNVPQWEKKLNSHDATPYQDAEPLGDMVKLNEILGSLKKLGYTIGIVSWLAKNSSYTYDWRVRQVKKGWLKKYLPSVTECHIVKYGTNKKGSCKIKNSILIDDDPQVRASWKGETIDATNFDQMLSSLEQLCKSA